MHYKKAFDQFKKRSAFYGLLFGLIITIVGAVIVLPGLYYKQQASARAVIPIVINKEPLPVAPEIKTGHPIRLIIASADIDISVTDGIYNESARTWNVSNTEAHFATITNQPNNYSGNTFIYGHNRPEVFYRLPKKTVAGDKAVIYTDNGLIFTYELREISETNPQDVSSLSILQEKPVLTLQTCSGAYFQNRQLFTFDFVSVEEGV
jgi:LPXTG-site transpeptidase (sortase) family protein